MEFSVVNLPIETSQQTLQDLVQEANASALIDGIVVQLPLPAHLKPNDVADWVLPHKDVDGFTTHNVGCMAKGDCGRAEFAGCTASAVVRLLKRHGVGLAQKHVAIVGRGNVVGMPLSLALNGEDATVTLCHSLTPNAAALTALADVVVAAAGVPHLIDSGWIRSGAVVVDVGINRDEEGRLCGDVVCNEAMLHKAAMITPVPGGVGPVTVAQLLENCVVSAERKERRLCVPSDRLISF